MLQAANTDLFSPLGLGLKLTIVSVKYTISFGN